MVQILLMTAFFLIGSFTYGNGKNHFPYGDFNSAEFTRDLTEGRRINWKPLVKGSAQCLSELERQEERLQRYYNAFVSNNEEATNQLFAEVISQIEHAGKCGEALWIGYLVGSFELGPYVEPKTQALPLSLVNSGRGPQGFLKTEMLFLILSLANNGNLLPLTKEVRENLSQGGDSDLWLMKENGNYLITGYYHCRESKLYIGFDLKPFNMASALTHEITHWFEDKIGFYTFFSNIFNQDQSVERFVVMDELKATLNGAFFQRSLLHPDLKEKVYSHYAGDLDFFAKGGSLDLLYESLGVPNGLNLSSFYHNYLRANRDQEEVRSEICKMMTLISEGYFNETPDCTQGLDFPGVSWVDTLDFRLNVMRESRLNGNISGMQQMLRKYLEYSEESSWACETYIESQTRGLLNNYVGTSLGEGGSGGNSGIRPCLRLRF